MLQATVQSYFVTNDTQDIIAVKQSKDVVANRFMSYGTFHTFVKPRMRYGFSFGGRMTGLQMDIDKLQRMAVAKDNKLATVASFNQSQGMRQSANEHLVPEQMFDNPDTAEKEVNGISAVKALELAQEQGQKIFTITEDNYNEVISQISLSSGAMSDISNAINAGKTVTTHQSNINYHGWNGSGYIILDPTTGTGAYLIDGGANGAWIIGVMIGRALRMAQILLNDFFKLDNKKAVARKFLASELSVVFAGVLVFAVSFLSVYIYQIKDDEKAIGCLLAGIGVGYGTSTMVEGALGKRVGDVLIGLIVTFIVQKQGKKINECVY